MKVWLRKKVGISQCRLFGCEMLIADTRARLSHTKAKAVTLPGLLGTGGASG